MNKLTALLTVGIVSLASLPALSADTPAAATPAQPAAGQLHGFDKYWSKIDPTGKGFISKEDWMKHQSEYFDEIDTNHDGKITKEEMKAHDDKVYQARRAAYKKQGQ